MNAKDSPSAPVVPTVVAAFDASTPLTARVGSAPRAFFDLLQLPDAKSHVLSDQERDRVAKAIARLSPLQQRVLAEHVRSISFVDGMPNNALTYPDKSDRTRKLYNITIRAGVLHETISELVTRKELSCYDASGSPLELSIDAGRMDALVYVFLHEATHVVDGSLGFTPDAGTVYPAASGFTAGIWADRLHVAPTYRNSLLDTTCWHVGGKTQKIDEAPMIYAAFEKTPFASLYGSNNWHDDIAELLAWYDLTQRQHQPYRIEIRKHGKLIYSYEPMKSPLVRSRFRYLQQFYAS